jgi:hypothetical protein
MSISWLKFFNPYPVLYLSWKRVFLPMANMARIYFRVFPALAPLLPCWESIISHKTYAITKVSAKAAMEVTSAPDEAINKAFYEKICNRIRIES